MAMKVSTFSLSLIFSIFALDICATKITKREVPSHTMPNWGGNFHFSTANIQYASTVEGVQQVVRSAKKLRALGVGHSFSEIANSDDTILSTYEMSSIIGINASVPSVTVQPGITYADLIPYLGLFFF